MTMKFTKLIPREFAILDKQIGIIVQQWKHQQTRNYMSDFSS